MRRIGLCVINVLESLLVLAVMLWACGVMYYHLPAIWRWMALGLWATLSVVLLVAVWTGRERLHAWLGLAFMLGLLLVAMGWTRIRPSQDRLWADDVAQQLQVVAFDGRHVVLDNVRDFRWRNETDYDIVWEQRNYDLDQLRSADLLLSYWMGPAVAHTLLSFGFADGQQLVFSFEIRKQQHERFDSIAGFFRHYELALIAADERDIVALRTNARGEDVYLYRLHGLDSAALKQLFMAYLLEAKRLDAEPTFYNTLTTNCTTVLWGLARTVAPGLPVDGRLLASGYFARYVHAQGGLAPGYSYQQLQQAGRITERARAAGADEAFSERIREGVPGVP